MPCHNRSMACASRPERAYRVLQGLARDLSLAVLFCAFVRIVSGWTQGIACGVAASMFAIVLAACRTMSTEIRLAVLEEMDELREAVDLSSFFRQKQVPCPNCANPASERVRVTWWALTMTDLLNVRYCGSCHLQFFGKAGKAVSRRLIINHALVVAMVVGIAILAGIHAITQGG